MRCFLIAILIAPCVGQPHNALPFDPRHHFDKRCPAGVTLDAVGMVRDPNSGSSYLSAVLPEGSKVADCAKACCGDWSCEAFIFDSQSRNCTFKDDIDALVQGPVKGVQSGIRAKLPSKSPPYRKSSAILQAALNPEIFIGVNGDEFPITWGRDGNQYTGAGDNHQVDKPASPLSFFKVAGGPKEMNCTHPPTKHNQPSPVCTNITMQGDSIPVKGPAFEKVCPQWRADTPNLKSSAVLSVDGVLYWAVSCFNYGDDGVFNRQRYGPAWIITSKDNGITWNLSATPTDMFPGRLAAPRFVQYGQDYAGAPDDWVYVYFPGTSSGSAFFENNDQMLLGRVNKHRILDRSAYQFFNGVQLDGADTWTSDSTIAEPVWSFPLMTSVQQVNYHAGAGRYIFANWAWISYDGYPRPDHTEDEKNSRTGHQRTQLLLVEAPTPWGPFSVFYRDDDWSASDGSVGGYTPVIPPAWVGKNDFWLVFTQCCGNPRPPLNNYNFNAQHVTFQIGDVEDSLIV